jgi:hypothetical protein|tara:strand:- start:521 stop:967 length:447 start_codon:yes stop_codon:yes gene_type:complete
MTKYILKNDSANRYCRICEDTTSRDHWLTPDIFVDHNSYIEISDEDYTSLQTGAKELTSKDPLNTTLIDSEIEDVSWTEEQIKNSLNELIKNLEGAVNNTKNPPSGWTTNLAALKAIDISSLSFPITGRNWVDCLIKNDIQVPSSMEF